MSRRPTPLLVFTAALAAASSPRAHAADDGPWLKALSDQFVVTDMAAGDLDGDGAEDVAVCYQVAADNPELGGGIALLQRRRGALQPGYHVLLERAWCDKVRIQDHKVGLLLKSRLSRARPKQLIWKYGRDFAFYGDEDHPLKGVRVSGSSSLEEGGMRRATATLDGELETSWAEGKRGTGIGETLTLRFASPIDIGYVAIFPGHGGDQRSFFDHNRLHRGSFETRTEEDLGDKVAGIDFSELGIDVGGDRVEFSTENRPEVRYVRVMKPRVAQLELRIESVYLGDKHDDTHLAEIEVVPTLRLTETLDRAEPLRRRAAPAHQAAEAGAVREEPTAPEAKASPKPKAAPASPFLENAEARLDEEVSGLIPDDF